MVQIPPEDSSIGEDGFVEEPASPPGAPESPGEVTAERSEPSPHVEGEPVIEAHPQRPHAATRIVDREGAAALEAAGKINVQHPRG
jgi:hypothetical protein